MDKSQLEKCGLEYWQKKGQSKQLLKSVCCQSKYLRTRDDIQNELGFGDDHDVLPLFKSGGMHGATLQRFRCVQNITTGTKYYQGKAYANQICFFFTVELEYLKTLEDFDTERVDGRANTWDSPTGGDKGDNPIVSSAVEVGNTIKNLFTHTLSD